MDMTSYQYMLKLESLLFECKDGDRLLDKYMPKSIQKPLQTVMQNSKP